MQIEYDGSHSITFFNYREVTSTVPLSELTYNTWQTWRLIPTTAPYVKPYEPALSIVEVPGSNKVLDLTEALSENVLYSRRTGEWEFLLDTERAKKTPWEVYYSIRDAIHGKWVIVALDDAPGHSYSGRITITDFNVGNDYAKIKFQYNLGARNAAWINNGSEIIRENESGSWTPENLDELEMPGFDISWVTPDPVMTEITVDDDGTMIATEDVPFIPEEIEIDSEDIYDETNGTYVTFYSDEYYTNPPDDEFVRIKTRDELETIYVPNGEDGVYSGGVPVSRKFGSERGAVFDHWEPSVTDLRSYGISYLETYAVFDCSDVELTVEFYNEETLLYTDIVTYGGTASYEGETPVHPNPNLDYMVFSGWSQSLENVTDDIRVYALFKEAEGTWHTVRFFNDDGSLLDAYTIRDGQEAVYYGQMPTSSVNSDAVFTGWDKADEMASVHDDIETTAIYDFSQIEYTVKFFNDDGTLLYETTVAAGGTAVYEGETPVSMIKSGSIFIGWDGLLNNITSNIDLHAKYDYLLAEYNVRFLNDDNSLIYSTSVLYGGTAIYEGSTPESVVYASIPEITTVFDRWDKSLSNVRSSFDAKAVYKVVSYSGYNKTDLLNLMYPEVVKDIVRNGLAEEVFEIGDQFNVKWTVDGVEYDCPFDVVHFGKVTDANGDEKQGMYLQSHKGLIQGTVYDTPRATYILDRDIEVGYYKIPSRNLYVNPPDTTGYTYLSRGFEAGTIIGLDLYYLKAQYIPNLPWGLSFYDKNTKKKIGTWRVDNSENNGEELFTAIGSNGSYFNRLNKLQNPGYFSRGYNNWKFSMARQWLNSYDLAEEWYNPSDEFSIYEFDFNDNQKIYEKDGYLRGIDQRLLRMISPITVKTVYTQNNSETIYVNETIDLMVLPSFSQIGMFTEKDGDIWALHYRTFNERTIESYKIEGEPFEYWLTSFREGISDTDYANTFVKTGSILPDRYGRSDGSYMFLRSTDGWNSEYPFSLQNTNVYLFSTIYYRHPDDLESYTLSFSAYSPIETVGSYRPYCVVY